MRIAGKTCSLIMTMLPALTLTALVRADSTANARLEGIRLYAAGHYREAIPCFDQVLARHGRDLEILLKRGACYLQTNQAEKALADFDRVNRQSSWFSAAFGARGILLPESTWLPQPAAWMSYAESWGNRGIALLMLGRNEEAVQSFRVATELWSQSQNRPGINLPGARAQLVRGRAAAYQGLGQAYLRVGEKDLAVRAYTEAITINPTDPNGFAGRGDILAALQMASEAIADYNEAIRLDATHSRALLGRGIVYADLGRDELALSDLNQAIELDPEYAKAYSHRGGLYARRRDNMAALSDYNALLRLLPGDAATLKDRGGILVRLGRFDEAIKDLDEAIRLDPKRATAYQNRGAAYNGLGQYERAVRDLSEAIRLRPENAGAHTNRGLARFATGSYDEAIVDLSEAIALAPRNAVPYFNRAEVFDRLGFRDRALDDYEHAIQLDPGLTAARTALAKLQNDPARGPSRALETDMAIQVDRGKENPAYDRGNSKRERGAWLAALREYDQAIVQQPRRAELYIARGWARLCTCTEGSDYDARAYLALQGWRDRFSPYMAVLGVLGARAAARPADAERLLADSLGNLPPRAWPVPVLRYLKGEITAGALLEAAANEKQQVDARAFLGVDRLRAGDVQAARNDLSWARDHAQPGSIAGDVARAFLARIGA
jgi:tetratricopeptide (TPR) repeat protein